MADEIKKSAWYSIKEAAEYLEIGEPTLYRWMRDRKITFRKVGDSTRFLQEDLDAGSWKCSTRTAMRIQVKQVCPVCHGTELLPGRLRSTGLLYFQLKKSKFWTLADNSIKSEGMICKRCGAVTLFGDLKKLARLDEKTDKEQSRKE